MHKGVIGVVLLIIILVIVALLIYLFNKRSKNGNKNNEYYSSEPDFLKSTSQVTSRCNTIKNWNVTESNTFRVKEETLIFDSVKFINLCTSTVKEFENLIFKINKHSNAGAFSNKYGTALKTYKDSGAIINQHFLDLINIVSDFLTRRTTRAFSTIQQNEFAKVYTFYINATGVNERQPISANWDAALDPNNFRHAWTFYQSNLSFHYRSLFDAMNFIHSFIMSVS